MFKQLSLAAFAAAVFATAGYSPVGGAGKESNDVAGRGGGEGGAVGDRRVHLSDEPWMSPRRISCNANM